MEEEMVNGNSYRNNGRFVPGHPGGPGRPRHCKPAETLRRALLDSVTPEQVRAVINKLYELALDGDVAAARCWLEHTTGRPVQAVHLSSPAAPKIDPVTVVHMIMDALSSLPNFDEIQKRVGEAFQSPKEPTHDGLARPESDDLNQLVG
jgi:hypothetical protein